MTKSLPSLLICLAMTLVATPAPGQRPIVEGQDRSGTRPPAERRRPARADAPWPGETAPEASAAFPPADRLMADMLATTRARNSISARLRQKITVLDQELVGTGLYLQQGRGENQKIRLELKLQVADRTTSMQQVCDGTFFWTHQDLIDKASLTRVDVSRIREAVFERGGRRGRFQQIDLALCGLPKLLESFHQAFEFQIVQQDRLDGVPVWVLRGAWRPEALAATYPPKKPKNGAGEGRGAPQLPAHAPDVMVLLVGCDDLFPYRIEFRRRVMRDDTAATPTDRTQPLVIMEWFEVALDTPIDERQFIYRPGDIEPVDGTKTLLAQLGLTDEPAD